MTEHAPPSINPGAELRYGMTLLTATHQYLAGELTAGAYTAVIEEATDDFAPTEPAALVRPGLAIGMELASRLAKATGTGRRNGPGQHRS
ncbi:hypothetical protein ACWGKK_12780 [Streptomyces chartreusis]